MAGSFGLVAGEGEATAQGALRPLAHVLAGLGASTGQAVHAVETSRPDAVLGLASKDCVLLANITPDVQTVILPSLPRAVTLIGGGALPVAGQVSLPPYGCIEIAL